MGKDRSAVALMHNANRRADRARRAKDTVNLVVPELMRASPRVRHGIHRAELIVEPDSATPNASFVAPPQSGPKIRIQCADTLTAAARLSERPFATKRTAPTIKTKQQRPNVAILNMASPLRPGGGFLDGANSQEEFLCARTTLYPSLWDQFYRLPEIGGVHTPDVMVFRDSTPEANELQKRDRFFVDVITAGMMRFPENRGRAEGIDSGCSCGVSYCDKDRELVTRKMKAVMRIAQGQGAEKLVLGAWGCGAYGNPVKEVAKIWRKVIAGGPRQRRPNTERWESIKEVIFAIPDRQMMKEFENAFSDILATDLPTPGSEEVSPSLRGSFNEDNDTAELISRIAETEMQIEETSNSRSRARLREILSTLNCELQRGIAASRFTSDDLTRTDDEAILTDEEIDNDFVITGIPASDGEVYFDENDVASDSSDAGMSEHYEFRTTEPARPSFFFSAAGPDHDPSAFGDDDEEDDLEHDQSLYGSLQPSPRFDAKTGWFNGSIDEFHGYLRTGLAPESASRGSPILQPMEADGIDELRLTDCLGAASLVEGSQDHPGEF